MFEGSVTNRTSIDPDRLRQRNAVRLSRRRREPLGFVNVHTIGVLKKMGYENIEPVQTEWGGLIPGLNANRFDIVTGGMNILASRCENIAFSEPMAKVGDGFIVAPGNPKGIGDYASLRDQGRRHGDRRGLLQHRGRQGRGRGGCQHHAGPGPTEILAAVRAGRADAGAGTYFTMKQLADSVGRRTSR
jgi:polar amino acid transport system substrate-binding protein